MIYELEERRVEELADVLRWIFAPALAFQVFSRFQTTEMYRFAAYRACNGRLVRGCSVALHTVNGMRGSRVVACRFRCCSAMRRDEWLVAWCWNARGVRAWIKFDAAFQQQDRTGTQQANSHRWAPLNIVRP